MGRGVVGIGLKGSECKLLLIEENGFRYQVSIFTDNWESTILKTSIKREDFYIIKIAQKFKVTHNQSQSVQPQIFKTKLSIWVFLEVRM